MINPATIIKTFAGIADWGYNLGWSIGGGDWEDVAFAGGQAAGVGATSFVGGKVITPVVNRAIAPVVSRTVSAVRQGYARVAPSVSRLGHRAADILRDTSGSVRIPGGGNITQGPKWSGSGPVSGTHGINANSISNRAINNYYPKRGGVEFVFDAKTNTFVVGKPNSSQFVGSPHQRLAASIGADGSSTTVGGMFSRGANGKILTNEFSGHFGQNWTPSIRQQFVSVMDSYGIKIIHDSW